MDCKKCGGTLELVDGRDHFRCDFCDSVQLFRNLTVDRIENLGQNVDEPCPVCQTTLSAAAIDGRRALFCKRCQGILISNDDFSDIIRGRRAAYQNAPQTPPPLNREELERTVVCPRCRGRMETYPYYGPGNVVIDCCSRCHVLWCDHAEIASIERAPGRR